MALIPADAFAVYRTEREDPSGGPTRVRLICWSELEGRLQGMVLSGGRPAPAEEIAGFQGYEPHISEEQRPSRCGRAVATLPPTPGCSVHRDDGTELPLIGWIVYENGDVHPAVLNREQGFAMDAEQGHEHGAEHEYAASRIRVAPASDSDSEDD